MAGLCLVLAIATYGSFIWAALAFFKPQSDSARFGRAVVSIAGLVATVSSLWGIGQNVRLTDVPLRDLASAILFLMASGLFWWTIFAVKKIRFDFAMSDVTPGAIAIDGPYQYVRHPFYGSYILGWLAGIVAAPSIIQIVAALALLGVYVVSAKREQEIILNSQFGASYAVYMGKTGMFFPALFKRG